MGKRGPEAEGVVVVCSKAASRGGPTALRGLCVSVSSGPL